MLYSSKIQFRLKSLGHILAIFGSTGKHYYIIYKLYSKLREYKLLDTVSNALGVPVPGTKGETEMFLFFFIAVDGARRVGKSFIVKEEQSIRELITLCLVLSFPYIKCQVGLVVKHGEAVLDGGLMLFGLAKKKGGGWIVNQVVA